MSCFSDKIKELRITKGLSLEQLALEFSKRYHSKISKSTISRWENNQAKPDIDDAHLYAKYFGVSLDWLMEREENTEPETIAAHHDGEEWTEEELKEIERFKEFVKSKRAQKGE
ncbi:helix-turn-helix transcriptional regulator [Bacillus sp. Bva_UNVM-123]|uniref:helix-turn-helix domain-containing protein n=1 Tax=Bacillus sp. Bva_UNVM-123 TaxID=2829798 RepID=UPI00391F89FD